MNFGIRLSLAGEIVSCKEVQLLEEMSVETFKQKLREISMEI